MYVMNSAKRAALVAEVTAAVNRASVESVAGNTPDFILAEYMVASLEAYVGALTARTNWYSGGEDPRVEPARDRTDPDDFGPAG